MELHKVKASDSNLSDANTTISWMLLLTKKQILEISGFI